MSISSNLTRPVHSYLPRMLIRTAMVFYFFLLAAVCALRPKPKPVPGDGRYNILLTGTFFSDNWIRPHLAPLAGSRHCRRIIMVSERRVPTIDKVETVMPPRFLTGLFGGDIARMLTFFALGICWRPQIVGGFHILVNGLSAALLARIVGARSMYFCGGGPREVSGGGYATGHKLFRHLGYPDEFVENLLIAAVQKIQIVITMGHTAKKFFRQRGVRSSIYVMPGGFDAQRFARAEGNKTFDLILVAMLSSVKRVDRFIHAVSLVKKLMPKIRAVVVGDGVDINPLKELSRTLHVDQNIKFVGKQDDVQEWLQRSKIFMLTSDSEGVSLAMMEAMLCGLPPIVSDVGDLSDIVEFGVNGYLVRSKEPIDFAAALAFLLRNPDRLDEMADRAVKTAKYYSMGVVSTRWDKILIA